MDEEVESSANAIVNPMSIQAKEGPTGEESSNSSSSSDNKVSLNVTGLKYQPAIDYYLESKNYLVSKLQLQKVMKVSTRLANSRNASLNGVSFTASSGGITAILGNDMSEIRTLLDLLAGRRKTGTFVGDVALRGIAPINANKPSKYAKNVCFVPHKTLYIPGLTYVETLRYAARLQLSHTNMTSGEIETRLQEVMTLMDLQRVKTRIIPEFPSYRGELGRDMRLLSIAMEIISLPPLIIIDDPVLQLDAGVAVKIFQILRTLARQGHIIICGMPKPNPSIAPYIDNVVLLSDGCSIYSAPTRHLERFFCSVEVGYALRKDVDIIDFILDIASGTERPEASRTAEAAIEIQSKFEQSSYYEAPIIDNQCISVFSPDLFRFYGYARLDNPATLIKRTWVVIDRAFISKIKDRETIKRSFGSSIMLSCVLGYIQLGQGNFGYYVMNVLQFPYLGTANITALLFFVNAFVFVQQVLNVHVICQKLQVYRYEQAAKHCTSLSFFIATVLSEVPFTILYAFVFASICYGLSDLNEGVYNFFYFNIVLWMLGIVGLGTALMLAAIFMKEIRVRDTYLICVFLMVLLSGFPFQIPHITPYMNQISQINPIRWTFEAFLAWKFLNHYHDGYYYIINFGAQDYNHDHIFETLSNFIIISWCIFFVLILPFPVLLRKVTGDNNNLRSLSQTRSQSKDSHTESYDNFDPTHLSKTPSVRHSELAKPLIFARESSISQKSKLSLSVTPFGDDTAYNARGPTVTYESLSYRIKDRASPLGYKTVLHNVSGQFNWGRLSMILGGSQSGKSSLLHILAGDVGLQSDITGDIRYNAKNVDPMKPLWQRCALVEAHDEQYHDLTVKEVITFAMKLRCLSRQGFSVVDENIKLTVEILHLDDILSKKVISLSRGQRRRLSIAEEIVHGPSLVLIDEPFTHLDLLDESVMMMTFREMVNQDKTVITTSYQPSSASFKLFDDVTLLSKGRIIYSGPTANAIKYFTSSPYGYDVTGYISNPGDFFIDISTSQLVDVTGKHVEATALESYYQQSEGYRSLIIRLHKHHVSSTMPSSSSSSSMPASSSAITRVGISPSSITETNPMNTSSSNDNSFNRKESFDIESSNNTALNAKIAHVPSTLSIIYQQIVSSCTYRPHDISLFFLKGSIILHRSSLGLWNRSQLTSTALFVYIVLACIFGWIIGDSSKQIYNSTSFFAVSPLLLFICNVIYIYYVFKSNQVFLKEQSRGLYSNFLHWLVASIPLYILQIINAIIFSVIAYKILNLNTDDSVYRYFISMNIIAILASFMMSEFVIYSVADIRSAYLVIPGLVLIQFAFSGLFIKTSSLPGWLSCWAPSVSMIRWALEGNFINQFQTSPVFVVINGFSTYDEFITLFAWTGQSRWLCLYNLLYFLLMFKVAALVANGIVTMYQKGGRSFKTIEED